MELGELHVPRAVIAVIQRGPEKTRLRAEPALQKRAQRAYAILPGELFAFGAAARVVVDGHFMDAVAESQDSGGDVRLDVEPCAAQAQAAPQVCAEHLVPGLHVGD